MKDQLLTLPNSLSLLRLVLVPCLIWTAIEGISSSFLWLLGVCFLSDILDGFLARRLNQVSVLGARLDSFGDILTYAAMILGLHQLWPSIFNEQAVFLFSATMSFLIPLIFAMSKFGEYPSYHTVGAKIAAVLLAPSYYILILVGADIWFRLVVFLYLLVAFEEILITLVLDAPKTNIKSIISLILDKS